MAAASRAVSKSTAVMDEATAVPRLVLRIGSDHIRAAVAAAAVDVVYLGSLRLPLEPAVMPM